MKKKRGELQPIGKRELITALIFSCTILAFIIPDLFSGVFPVFSAYMQSLGLVTPALAGVSLMAIIRTDGVPLLDFRSAMKEMPWHTIFLAAGQCVLSASVTAESTGIVPWLHSIVTPLAGALFSNHWILAALFTAAATAILTNFLSGVVTMNILFTLILPLTLSGTGSVYAVGIGMVIGVITNLGVMTPPASLGAAVFLSSDYLTVGEGCKYGLLFCLCTVFTGVFVIYPLSCLFI